MTTISSSGHWSISRGGISIPSGTSMCPSVRPMLTFLRIERPTSATLRSCAAAASTTCWTRWMFDAKQVTTMRPWQRANTRSRCGPTIDSLTDDARPVGVRRVAAQQQHAVAAELGQPRHVGRRAADRRLVELVVAGEQDRAELAVVSATPDASGIECVRWMSSISNGPACTIWPIGSTSRFDLAQLVLVELGARHGDRQLAAVDDRDRSPGRGRAAPTAARRGGPRGRG